jgi:hypothetical protein
MPKGVRSMSAMGQTEKNSVRAEVFRIAPESGPCAIQSVLRICASNSEVDLSLGRSAHFKRDRAADLFIRRYSRRGASSAARIDLGQLSTAAFPLVSRSRLGPHQLVGGQARNFIHESHNQGFRC